MKNPGNGSEHESADTKVVKVEWESDEGHLFPLAAHMLVNFDNDHFYVRFFQVTPPAVQDAASLPESVKAKMVADVTIPHGRMRSMIRALEENFATYQKTFGRGDDEAFADNGWEEDSDNE